MHGRPRILTILNISNAISSGFADRVKLELWPWLSSCSSLGLRVSAGRASKRFRGLSPHRRECRRCVVRAGQSGNARGNRAQALLAHVSCQLNVPAVFSINVLTPARPDAEVAIGRADIASAYVNVRDQIHPVNVFLRRSPIQTRRLLCFRMRFDLPAVANDGFPPSTSTIRHMLHRASASAKRLAAALRRAVPEWQLLSGWVQTGREENGSLRNGKAIIFGRTGVRSCQRHVNARMSFCECF